MLADDIRDCPSTWTLAAAWVGIFALMHLVQWQMGIPLPGGGLANPLGVSSQVGHRFGDMTWAEVRHGEAWRLVTATFVHFSLIHVAMNAFGLVKLGQLIEPWYRSGPFLALCVAIGGLGNLVGGLIRQGVTSARGALVGSRLAQAWPSWFGASGGLDGLDRSFGIPSGGGSTILLGLLGLAAVVGWRSKTRIGSFLRDQMVTLLGFTAVLGVVLSNLIDNYGHAGGAVVGALFGFAHRPILRLSERSRPFRVACWVVVAGALGACVAAGVRDDRSERATRTDFLQTSARFQLDIATLGDLERVSVLATRHLGLTADSGVLGDLDVLALEPLLKGVATAPLPTTPQPVPPAAWRERTRADLAVALQALADHPAGSWGDGVDESLATVQGLARASLSDAPDYRQAYAFVVAWRAATRAILLDRDDAQARLLRIERRAQ